MGIIQAVVNGSEAVKEYSHNIRENAQYYAQDKNPLLQLANTIVQLQVMRVLPYIQIGKSGTPFGEAWPLLPLLPGIAGIMYGAAVFASGVDLAARGINACLGDGQFTRESEDKTRMAVSAAFVAFALAKHYSLPQVPDIELGVTLLSAGYCAYQAHHRGRE